MGHLHHGWGIHGRVKEPLRRLVHHGSGHGGIDGLCAGVKSVVDDVSDLPLAELSQERVKHCVRNLLLSGSLQMGRYLPVDVCLWSSVWRLL